MCGIIGYIGPNDAREIIINSLELLEYRGYDSAGVAFHNGKNIEIYKKAARVSEIREMIRDVNYKIRGGIGHTRWATHGSVRDINAHPHKSGLVTLVHNGIIENYKELIKTYQLQNQLISTGDSEVAAVLLNNFYHGEPEEAIWHLTELIEGTYSLAIMFEDRPDEIYAIRKVSPIVVACKDHDRVLASDLVALSNFTDEYYILPEMTLLKMDASGIRFSDKEGKEVLPPKEHLNWEIEQYSKQHYPFYMEKEISEQPEVIEKTIREYLKDGLPWFSEEFDQLIRDVDEVDFVACGTSSNAGLIGKSLLERICRLKANVILASEFIYSDPILDKSTLVVGISQSGETIDTLEGLRIAKRNGCPVVSIINVRGSSIAQISDQNIFTMAGPEIAVASTKAYTCQLAVLFLFAYRIALVKGKCSEQEVREKVNELLKVPEAIQKILDDRQKYRLIARDVISAKNLFMIGRGLDYYVLLEGALKLKEISYIHTEAYAAGELKHGPIALIEQGTPVVAVLTQEKLLSKESSNIKEVRARGARAIAFIKESYSDRIEQAIPIHLLPDLQDDLMVFPAVVALQLFAYYVAVDKGYNVDKPRNLAKVVTVE